MKAFKKIIPAFLLGAFFCPLEAYSNEENQLHIVDWADGLGPGSPLPRIDEERRIAFSDIWLGIEVVDTSTEPPTPFPGASQALRVRYSPDDPLWFRLHFRPFDEGVRSGAFEVDVVPVSGSTYISIGANENAWESSMAGTYHRKRHDASLRLKPGENIHLNDKPVTGGQIDLVEANAVYRILVKWDFNASPAGYRFYVNNEPLVYVDGRDTFLPISTEKYGVNAFGVSSGRREDSGCEFFLGPLRAWAGEVDMSEGEEPRFNQPQ